MELHQPNPTLYIKNIDWKIKKNLLRRALYTLFSRYGKVLEIITLRKDGLRGQAFVLMDSVQAATAALQKEQGFTFFGKDLVIEYAKNKSDRIAKRDGDYVPKAKRQKKKDTAADAVATHTTEEAETPTIPTTTAPPSKILMAQNLPTECNEKMLHVLFQQYGGYVEARMPRPGLAFIEFQDTSKASLAYEALNGFKLTKTDTLQLGYGKE